MDTGDIQKQDPSHPLICNCSQRPERSLTSVQVGSIFSTFIVIQMLRKCPLIYPSLTPMCER